MRVKLYNGDTDYEMLQRWWVASGTPVVNASQLETLGMISYTDDNQPACAVFAYLSKGVSVAFLEHFISSPMVKSPIQKLKASDYLLNHMLDILSCDGYQLVRASTWSETLAKVCQKRFGFQLIGNNYHNLSLIV